MLKRGCCLPPPPYQNLKDLAGKKILVWLRHFLAVSVLAGCFTFVGCFSARSLLSAHTKQHLPLSIFNDCFL